ncbi:MAG: hypothetical protein AAGA92_07340 [Planctomycetota bacterium]
MRTVRAIVRWACFCLATAVLPGVCLGQGYQGMSLFGFGGALGNPDLRESLHNMQTLGVDTVALNVWWKQDNKFSSSVYEDVGGISASVTEVEAAIDLIHDLGMQVYLKPQIDSGDGVWRALIEPTDPNAWLSSYGSFIHTYADIAESKNVALFSIGTEMESMANNPAYTPQWTGIINGVRSRYSGPVTYAGNHGDASDGVNNFGSYQDVPWWGQLDTIGVDAYFPLTGKNNPTPAELESAWTARANEIESWRSSQGLSQQVLFTEVGYSAYDGTNQTPWAGAGGAPQDEQEQADAYDALLTVMNGRSWWDGAFWWAWESLPHAGVVQPTGFTPQDRVVQQVLATEYGGEVPLPAPRAPERLAGWDGDLAGFSAGNGAALANGSAGVTQGDGSLAVTSPDDSFRWAVSKLLTASSGNTYRSLVEAASDPSGYLLEFDVTYDTDSIPQGQVNYVDVFVSINSPAGWSQIDSVATASGQSDETIRVSIPLDQFTLAELSSWYGINFAVTGNWGASPATFYFDDLRLVDLDAPAAGDFNGDGSIDGADLAYWEESTGWSAHGDADGDTDSDLADLLAWQRAEGSAAIAATPEPAGIALLLVGLVCTGWRAAFGARQGH